MATSVIPNGVETAWAGINIGNTIIQPIRTPFHMAEIMYTQRVGATVAHELHLGKDGTPILTQWWPVLKAWTVYVIVRD